MPDTLVGFYSTYDEIINVIRWAYAYSRLVVIGRGVSTMLSFTSKRCRALHGYASTFGLIIVNVKVNQLIGADGLPKAVWGYQATRLYFGGAKFVVDVVRLIDLLYLG